MKPKDYMQETLVFVQHLEFISGTCRAEKKAKILQAAPPPQQSQFGWSCVMATTNLNEHSNIG